MRAAMSTMGMLDSAYWTSWAIPEVLMGLLHAVLMSTTALVLGFSMVGWGLAGNRVEVGGEGRGRNGWGRCQEIVVSRCLQMP